jgi:hypothetical protein
VLPQIIPAKANIEFSMEDQRDHPPLFKFENNHQRGIELDPATEQSFTLLSQKRRRRLVEYISTKELDQIII